MTKKYDLIIVGAGMSGFPAARAAAESGLEVALIDRKTDITSFNRSCAQTLVSYSEPYMKNFVVLNNRDNLMTFTTEGFSLRYDGPWRNLYAWFFYAPSGHAVMLGDPDEGRKIGNLARAGVVIDKEHFFRNQLEDVKKLHVDVFPGIYVDKVSGGPDGVRVEGSGKVFEGTYGIAADGVNSRVAELLGMNKSRYYWCNLIILSYFFKGIEADPNCIVTSTGFFKNGTALFFMAPRPYENEWNVQFLTVNPNVDLKAAADYFFKEAFTAKWFKNAKQRKTMSAVCSCYDAIHDPFKDNFLVVGDVGSTQELENTGAMMTGWKAGQAIATSIRERQVNMPVTGIKHYSDWWDETYVKGYDHEAYMKNWVLGFVLNKAEDMSYVFGLVKDRLPPNFNPYSAPKMMGRKLGTLGPTIAAERPDLLPRMAKLRQPLKEVFMEVTKISKPVIS